MWVCLLKSKCLLHPEESFRDPKKIAVSHLAGILEIFCVQISIENVSNWSKDASTAEPKLKESFPFPIAKNIRYFASYLYAITYATIARKKIKFDCGGMLYILPHFLEKKKKKH